MPLAPGDEIRFRYLSIVTRGTVVGVDGDSVVVEYTTRRTGTSRVRISVSDIV